MVATSKRAESLGVIMNSRYEYDLATLGHMGWEREDETRWTTSDCNPAAFGLQRTIWWDKDDGRYLHDDGTPVFFAGTDPRNPGYPPSEDALCIDTPEEEWESALRSDNPQAWRKYRSSGQWPHRDDE